jgi:cytochrome c
MPRHHSAAPFVFCLIISALIVSACGQQPSGQPKTTEVTTGPMASKPVLSEAQKATILAGFPAPYTSADLKAGEKQWLKCRSCHTLGEGEMNMVGPNLYTVFGRRAGHYSGYAFSKAMMAHNVVWDFASLDAYIEAPQTVVKGTKMGYMGIKKSKDRQDLLAYMRVETTPPEGLK